MGGDHLTNRIRVSGVIELALEVLDLDRAEVFYADVLGFPVVERCEERGTCDRQRPGRGARPLRAAHR